MPSAKERYPHQDLENLAEEIVYPELDRIIRTGETDFCQCDVCIQDIVALTLNRIPSLYCSSMADKLSPGPNLASKADQVRNLAQDVLPEAIEQVASAAHH
jgi:competence protein ComFB